VALGERFRGALKNVFDKTMRRLEPISEAALPQAGRALYAFRNHAPVDPAAQPALGPGFPSLPELRMLSPFAGAHGIEKAGLPLADGCFEFEVYGAGKDLKSAPDKVGTLRLESLEAGLFIGSADFYEFDAESGRDFLRTRGVGVLAPLRARVSAGTLPRILAFQGF